jgi:3-oxoacyl-[acyl-carrier protein] reductase
MNDRVALITGGSRGIGRAVAMQLADDGYDIAFCYRSDAAAAEEVAGMLSAMGRRVFFRQCDVSSMESAQEFVASTEETLGPISVVVNSAGGIRDSPLLTMTADAWRDVITTNLDGVFNVCRAAVFGLMKRKSGVIVNISSISGVHGNATQSNYSASKAGIIGFSKALSKELGPFGIRVNVVAPGFIATDMTAGTDQKRIDRLLPAISLRRIGQPCEVAHLVSFMVSQRARYITGQVLQVDGGLVL